MLKFEKKSVAKRLILQFSDVEWCATNNGRLNRRRAVLACLMYRENVTTRKTKPHFTVFGSRKVRKSETRDRETDCLERGGGKRVRGRRTTFTSIQKVEQTALLCHQSVTLHWTNVWLTPRFGSKSRPQIHPEIRFFRVKTSIIVYLPYCMTYRSNILLICEVGFITFVRDSGQRSSHQRCSQPFFLRKMQD